MDASAIRQAIREQPFRPFRPRIADGRDFEARHPETVAVSPNDRQVALFQPGHRMVILEPLPITSLEYTVSSPSESAS